MGLERGLEGIHARTLAHTLTAAWSTMLPPPPRLPAPPHPARRWTPGAWHRLGPVRTRLSCTAPRAAQVAGVLVPAPQPAREAGGSGCHAACRGEERGSRRTKSRRWEEPSSGPRLPQGLSGRWSRVGAAPLASRGPDTRAAPVGLGLLDTPPGPGSRLPPLPTPTQRPERPVLFPRPLCPPEAPTLGSP